MIDRSGYQRVAEDSRTAFDALSDKDVTNGAFRYEARVTSGTSGGEQFLSIVRSHEHAFRRAEGMTRCLLATGSRNSRLANLRYSLYGEGIAHTLSVDVRELECAALMAIEDFAADGVYGFPSFVVRLIKALSQSARARITRCSFVGERLSPAHLEVLTRLVPQAMLRNVYASAEFGVIGYQCPDLSLSEFHPVTGITFSVINIDENGIGEIVLARHQEGNVVVDGYRNGDAVRPVDRPCACGVKLTFEQMGRVGYDFVKAAGLTFHVDAFDKAARIAGLGIDDYRVEIRTLAENARILPQLSVLLRTNTPASGIQSVQNAFEKIRLTPTRSLGDLIRDSICAPLLFANLEDGVIEKKSIRLKVIE
jgi:phenylacetate-coenzyme A ligase PaaK-like adenylate-forming protein